MVAARLAPRIRALAPGELRDRRRVQRGDVLRSGVDRRAQGRGHRGTLSRAAGLLLRAQEARCAAARAPGRPPLPGVQGRVREGGRAHDELLRFRCRGSGGSAPDGSLRSGRDCRRRRPGPDRRPGRARRAQAGLFECRHVPACGERQGGAPGRPACPSSRHHGAPAGPRHRHVSRRGSIPGGGAASDRPGNGADRALGARALLSRPAQLRSAPDAAGVRRVHSTSGRDRRCAAGGAGGSGIRAPAHPAEHRRAAFGARHATGLAQADGGL